MTTLRFLRIVFALALVFESGIAGAQTERDSISVAYFLEWPLPMLHAKAEGKYEEALGVNINWVSFDTGVAMSAAMASGDVQIAVSQGMPPFVVAAAAGQELQIVDVAVSYPENDDCVVSTDLNIDKSSIAKLSGRTVAVPLGTASHYNFLRLMDHLGVDITSLEIVDMAPVEGAAALASGSVDMACGWGGALRRMKEHGNVLLSSVEREEAGIFVFDVTSSSSSFIEENADLLAKFLAVTAEANSMWRDPEQQEVMLPSIAKEAGMSVESTRTTIDSFVFPSVEEQLSSKWLGGAVQTYSVGLSDVFVSSGSINSAVSSPEVVVALGPLQSISKRLNDAFEALAGGEQIVEKTLFLETRFARSEFVVLKRPRPDADVLFMALENERYLLREVITTQSGLQWALIEDVSASTKSVTGYVFVTNNPVEALLSRHDERKRNNYSLEGSSRGPQPVVFGPQSGVTPNGRAGAFGRKIALVVGVSDYEHMQAPNNATRLDALYDLRFAENDARDFAQLLTDESRFGPGWEVHLLVGPQATEHAVEEAMDEVFAGSLSDNDLVFLFFAGHGRVNPRNSRDVRLLLWDSDPARAQAGLRYDVVRRQFLSSDAGYSVAFIDACRSGAIGLARGTDRPSNNLLGEVLQQRPSKVIYTAGSGDQLAYEDPILNNGVFTHYLLQGLRGEAADTDRDGVVDLGELDRFVGDAVNLHTSQHEAMLRQTPRLHSDSALFPQHFPLAIRLN